MSSVSKITNFRPTNVIASVKETDKAIRELKKVDPRSRYVLLFPDSSRFYVGIGLNTVGPHTEKVYEEASSIVKKDMSKLCLESDRSEVMDSLENRHLCAFVTSHAALSKLSQERPEVIPISKAAGGFGVGYINSLVFGKSITFENGLDLVQRQAQKMDALNKAAPTAKLSVITKRGVNKLRVCQAAREHCLNLGIPREIAICNISGMIYDGKFEVVGHEEAIKYLESEGERLLGIAYCKRLKSIDNFNSPLMLPVREYLKDYIEQRLKADRNYLTEPSTCSVYSGTSARRTRTLKDIKHMICEYPVKFSRVQGLLTTLFKRPVSLAQPNIIILWDHYLLHCLRKVNRRAYEASRVFR